jgi:hypothetical protein
MRKTKVGNIEIIIDPQDNDRMIFLDANDMISKTRRYGSVANETSGNLYDCVQVTTDLTDIRPSDLDPAFVKEPGRARKIYNRLRRFLYG